MNEKLTRLRYKLASIIKPKRRYTIKVGKLGILSLVEGSDKANLSLLNGTIKVSFSLMDIVKNLKG